MTVKELREALEDIPDEAVVLHATVRWEGQTIILTTGDDEDDDDFEEEDGNSIDWPEDET